MANPAQGEVTEANRSDGDDEGQTENDAKQVDEKDEEGEDPSKRNEEAAVGVGGNKTQQPSQSGPRPLYYEHPWAPYPGYYQPPPPSYPIASNHSPPNPQAKVASYIDMAQMPDPPPDLP